MEADRDLRDLIPEPIIILPIAETDGVTDDDTSWNGYSVMLDHDYVSQFTGI